jgi:hypothetical protein
VSRRRNVRRLACPCVSAGFAFTHITDDCTLANITHAAQCVHRVRRHVALIAVYLA